VSVCCKSIRLIQKFVNYFATINVEIIAEKDALFSKYLLCQFIVVWNFIQTTTLRSTEFLSYEDKRRLNILEPEHALEFHDPQKIHQSAFDEVAENK